MRSGTTPSEQAVILLHLAGLYAMQDDIAAAHATLGRAKTLLDSPRPDDDRGGYPARRLRRDARR